MSRAIPAARSLACARIGRRSAPSPWKALIAAMDEAGVAKAAIVQASTCYGFDNSYVVRLHAQVSRAARRGRLRRSAAARCAGDDPDVGDRGVAGFRLFTGGSTKAFDPSSLDDPTSFPAWELCGEAGHVDVPADRPHRFAAGAGLAKRFPKVKIILDHLRRGPMYRRPAIPERPPACSTWRTIENIYLKLTPRVFGESCSRGGHAGYLLPEAGGGIWQPGAWRGVRTSQPPQGPVSANLDKAKAGPRLAFGGRPGVDLRQDGADALSEAGRLRR